MNQAPQFIPTEQLTDALEELRKVDEHYNRMVWGCIEILAGKSSRTSCCDALTDEGVCCKCRRKVEAS